MAAHVVRVSPAHNPSYRRRRWPLRLLGLLATAAFLGSGAAIALMVMPDSHTVAALKGLPKAKAKPAHKTHRAGLTKAQKHERAAALGALRSEGYDPAKLADWRPRADLQVLVGHNEQGAMRAYFFSGGKFLGHDDASTSNAIRVAKQGKDSITLAYRVSTGGHQNVTFQLLNGTVTPTTPIPPLSVR